MHVSWPRVRGEANDRYEPLPGFFELPGFLWRKLPRAGKVAVAALGVGVVVLAIVLSPVIQSSKERHARADAALQARSDRKEIAEIRREQRPRFGRGAPAAADVAARERLGSAPPGSVKADADPPGPPGGVPGP